MKIALVTLFPDLIDHFVQLGVTGRSVGKGGVEMHCVSPRDFAPDRHQTVDDRPYGGGPGMVMQCGPLQAAIETALDWAGGHANCRVIYLSPQGATLTQKRADQIAGSGKNLVLIAGRYEGIDQRVIDSLIDEEISIGDYVLSGGELPALVLVDAILRKIPGVLGHEESAQQDSFSEGLLDWPHYTRPEEYQGQPVPPVLLSGDHAAIDRWRRQQALSKTRQYRPDLVLEHWFESRQGVQHGRKT